MKNQKKLKFLGTGSCFNIKAGNNCAYYYNKDKGQLLLLDCGEDVFSKAVMKFKNLKKVVIIITHFHSDHMGSLPSFIYYCKIAFNIKPIVIYPNDSICKLLENMGVSRDLYIHKKRAIFIDDVVNIEHYSSLESYGYVLKFGKRKIYYSGDSKRLPIDILEKFIEGKIDYLYHDMTKYVNDSHANVDDMANIIPKHLRRYVFAMHLDDQETKKIAKKYGFKIAR